MTTPPLRIVYMGTPDFAVPALKALLESHHHVVGVFTNPDRPSGRGKKLTPSPVKALALTHDVPVYQPQRVRKNPEALKTLQDFKPDLVVVAAYGQILPQSILDVPPMGCLNVHASLLPAYRGAAPINWCIVRGEKEAGVTIMRMELGLDTGPMYLKGSVEIPELMIAQDLHDALSALGAPLLLKTIEGLQNDALTPEPQDDELASWAPMIKKSDGLIDWTKSGREVADLIRGFNPWPGTYSFFFSGDESKGARFKMHLAQTSDVAHDAAPGEVILAQKDKLVVACGQGAVELLSLQSPGKRAMSARDVMNGTQINAGDRFRPTETL